jgi:hypothetical protein
MTDTPDRRSVYGTRRSDPAVPSAARVYDFLLGGTYNYESDQVAAAQLMRKFPMVPVLARYNRDWVQRAVRELARRGVRQFLDIGAGIPTAGNVHEIVQGIAPTARVVYVDYEMVAIDLGREILATNPYAISVHADMRLPETILNDPDVRELLDFDKPVACVWGSMLHFLLDEDDPVGMVEQYKRRLAPGSFVALSHASEDLLGPGPLQAFREFVDTYNSTVDETLTLRPVVEIERFFHGTELIAPGLVPVPDWLPDDPDDVPDEHDPARSVLVGGVGRLL